MLSTKLGKFFRNNGFSSSRQVIKARQCPARKPKSVFVAPKCDIESGKCVFVFLRRPTWPVCPTFSRKRQTAVLPCQEKVVTLPYGLTLTMITNMKKYVCTVCGYVYDPAVGDPDSGIEPGTAFEDIPADWVCPLCGVGKDDFEVSEE